MLTFVNSPVEIDTRVRDGVSFVPLKLALFPHKRFEKHPLPMPYPHFPTEPVPSLRDRWRFIRQSLKQGLNARRSWRYVRRHGRDVKAAHGVGLMKQFFSISWVALRYHTPPEAYYYYRLYAQPLSLAPLYIISSAQKARMRFTRIGLGGELDCLRFKRRFENICRDAGLAVASTVAEFDKGEVLWCYGDSLPDCDLFCKHAASEQGAGADTWDYLGNRQWRAMSGAVLDESMLLAELKKISVTEPLLLQVKLRNHSDINDISPGGISSLRVVTGMELGTSKIRVYATTFKMLKAGEVTDHWKHGGVASGVDIDTGTLRPGRIREVAKAHLDFHQHPDTGAQITGRKLALWPEVVKLTTSAHALYKQFPFLGWDVAMTPDGPVLLEGNLGWDARLIQQPCDYPLGAPAFFKDYYPWYEKAMKLGKALPDAPIYFNWQHSLQALDAQR